MLDSILNLLKERGVSEDIMNQAKTHLEGVDFTKIDVVKEKLQSAGVPQNVVDMVKLPEMPDAGGVMGMVSGAVDKVKGMLGM